jgi:FtsZ-binding cell division protein ZapB
MINLEQVKLLEAKVGKAIDFVERLARENILLRRQESELQARLGSYQKRIDELEVLVTGFKDDQGRIEEGILSALDRLSQFEKAMEKSLKDAKASNSKSAGTKAAKESVSKPQPEETAQGQTCFEIPENTAEGDIPDPLTASSDNAPSADGDGSSDEVPLIDVNSVPEEDGELEIF